jgi:hydrogenase maturation protease
MKKVGSGRTLIVGVGNELLGDEGLGVHVARHLLSSPDALPSSVDVVEAGTALFSVLGEASAYGRVILVDAVSTSRPPGTMYRLELDGEVEPGLSEPARFSLHEQDLFATLVDAKLMGLLPTRLTLFGVEPARVRPALNLSPALRRALPRIVSAVLAEATDPRHA